MHGLSIVQGFLDAITEDARSKGIARVNLIRISAGELSGVSSEELRFGYSLIVGGAGHNSRSAIFENATLEIVSEPGSREVKIVFYEGFTSPPT